MFYLELLDSYFPSNVFSYKDLVLSFLHDLPFGLAEQMIVPKIIQSSTDQDEVNRKISDQLKSEIRITQLGLGSDCSVSGALMRFG